MWSELTPTLELLNSSFINNPIPYIKRSIQIASLRRDLKSKLFRQQKKICPLCKLKLVDWDDFLTVDDTDFFMDKFNQNNPSWAEISINEYNSAAINLISNEKFNMNYKMNISPENFNDILTLKSINLSYCKTKDWSKDLKMDHIIPIKLATADETLRILLGSIVNLRLVHKSCHKNKTFGSQEQNLIKEYRKYRQSLLPEQIKIKTLSEEELRNLHTNTILKLNKDQKFKFLHESKIKPIQKLFKSFISKIIEINNL